MTLIHKKLSTLLLVLTEKDIKERKIYKKKEKVLEVVMGKKRKSFEHDCNAHKDEKIQALITIFDMIGYGWFWYIVERMSQCKDYKLIPTEETLKEMAKDLNTSTTQVSQFLAHCTISPINLFKYSEKENAYWSDTLVVRMRKAKKKTDAKRKAGKAGMKKRWSDEEKKPKKKGLSDENLEKLYSQVLRYFPDKLHPRTNAIKDKWLKTLDELIRIDGLTEDEIIRIVKKTRDDDFWKDNFMSVVKLRRKNKEGVMYWLVFQCKFDEKKTKKPQFKTGGTRWLKKGING